MTTRRGRVAVAAGWTGALLTALRYFAVSSITAPAQVGEAVFYVIILPLVAGMVYWGTGRRGLTVLWMIMIVLWATLIVEAGLDDGWSVSRVMYFVPEKAGAWSVLVLPLTVFSVWVLHDEGGEVRRQGLVGPLAWLVLAAASMTLAQYGPDVGPSPRQNTWIALPLELVATVCPFALGGWFLLRLRQPSAATSREP